VFEELAVGAWLEWSGRRGGLLVWREIEDRAHNCHGPRRAHLRSKVVVTTSQELSQDLSENKKCLRKHNLGRLRLLYPEFNLV